MDHNYNICSNCFSINNFVMGSDICQSYITSALKVEVLKFGYKTLLTRQFCPKPLYSMDWLLSRCLALENWELMSLFVEIRNYLVLENAQLSRGTTRKTIPPFFISRSPSGSLCRTPRAFTIGGREMVILLGDAILFQHKADAWFSTR